ncbi:hypothetical protein BGZ95_002044 [Linnemannia exigua]|uniref:Kazal-like domain-containing protein n=1 Tax=Linnemannia exigua TaxID=604196 RepID=A0AAD4DIP3_9FUNG|nr:hypothetical protein BGZ95_002044 [Linnemannia exigua]
MQFTTLITLTVATSMAALSALAAPTPACGTICPTVYQPVCARAIDGLNKVFGNACELKNYNCKHPNANFAVVADSNCQDFVAAAVPAAACGTICPTVYQPVCAKAIDGLNKTFGNACELKNYNCKHPNANFVVVADSNCRDLIAADAAPTAPACGTICPAIYQPVCAKAKTGLNKSFVNPCELKNYNCKHPNANFTVVANADCADLIACSATPATCPTACAEIYKPVCAKYINGDLQTFANKCEMNIFNCKNPAIAFTAVVEGACDN